MSFFKEPPRPGKFTTFSALALLFQAISGIYVFCDETRPAVPRHVAVVMPQRYVETLKPWIAHRAAQGYEVHRLVEELDTATPERIRQRIRDLAQRVPLSALLLVGNARVETDGRPSGAVPSPRIPCRVIQHFGKETHLASDDWYADLDGDDRPDLAVGRFPIDSTPQLESLIRKTIAYETSNFPRSRKIQIVAGTGNFSPLLDGVIETAVRHAISETVPSDWDLAFLHADPTGAFCPFPLDFQDELIETVNRSPFFWAYFGHGLHRMLDPLSTPYGNFPTLVADNAARFVSRDGFPIALLFCCYGGFLDRETPSLAEEMLLQPGGPVAVVAASRTTMPYGMNVLGVELFREILQSRDESGVNRMELGTLLRAAKCRMLSETEAATSDGSGRQRSGVRKKLETMAKSFDPTAAHLDIQLQEHAAMFHLFGDPLLSIPFPGRIRLTAPDRCRPGETIRIDGEFERIPTDDVSNTQTVRLELLPALNRITLRSPDRDAEQLRPTDREARNREYENSNDRVILAKNVPFSDHQDRATFTTELTIPEKLTGRYVLRVFYASTSGIAMGYADFSIGLRRSGK